MRLCYGVAICLVCGWLAGCEAEQQTACGPEVNLDAELVRTLNDIGIENAILAQHTLYPYHFVSNADTLNELGQRDLAVLARHFREHPGALQIQGPDGDGDLYEARVAHVLGRLKDASVDTARMTVSEGMPGGSGVASGRVITILEKEASEGLTTTGISSSGSSGSGGMSAQ